ncbi:hypothetical protein [Actinoplanes couchii]|nr:hypothetical protein [Actinoplanes couchii]MDR6326212.1 hypothetical protein [Actinoplanes couchii]
MTDQQPGTVGMNEGTNNLTLGIAVAILGIIVFALAGLAVIDPVALIGLAPVWLTRPGHASGIAATALTLAISGLLYQAVRIANRGNDETATWLTLAALLMVPWFSLI